MLLRLYLFYLFIRSEYLFCVHFYFSSINVTPHIKGFIFYRTSIAMKNTLYYNVRIHIDKVLELPRGYPFCLRQMKRFHLASNFGSEK